MFLNATSAKIAGAHAERLAPGHPFLDQSMLTTPHPPSAYGGQMAKYYHLGQAPSLLISSTETLQLAITRITSDIGLSERTLSIPSEKAFVVSVHLTPASDRGCELWIDDTYSRIMEWPAGGVGIYNLESNPRKRNPSPVDWVHYYIPRSALDAFTDYAEILGIQSLECLHGTVDPTLYQLTQIMLPSLITPQIYSEFFLDHFRLLFFAHIARTYAPSSGPIKEYKGGLAPWQRRRVMELFGDQLDRTLRLASLAHECGLSVSHFARSFRRSFGTSVHRYLISQRVEMAKALLSTTDRSLPEVALHVGFSDQAALNRTFKTVVGTPPGKWRREISARKLPLNSVHQENLSLARFAHALD
jgi:AraC family transcriptional regulator